MTFAQWKHDRNLQAFVCALILLVFIAWQVMRGGAADFDRVVRGAVHSLALPALTQVMEVATSVGEAWFLIGIGAPLCAVFLLKGRRRAASFLALGSLGGLALNEGLKQLFQRSRPHTFFGAYQPQDYSFPSGHSAGSTCFFCGLALIASLEWPEREHKTEMWCLAITTAAMVGLSRIYLGMHYPSDVLGGFTEGTMWLLLVWRVVYRNRAVKEPS